MLREKINHKIENSLKQSSESQQNTVTDTASSITRGWENRGADAYGFGVMQIGRGVGKLSSVIKWAALWWTQMSAFCEVNKKEHTCLHIGKWLTLRHFVNKAV